MHTFENFMQKQTNKSTMKRLDYVKTFSLDKALASTNMALNFEKKKALIICYCLIQFRNFKATSFNILYLVVAVVLKQIWKKQPYIMEAVEEIISILKCNISTSMSNH